MDNIVKVNERQERLFKLISGWGFALFIIAGVVGCSVLESGGTIFGGVFIIVGVLIDYVSTKYKIDLQESGGALTKRKLVEEDLEGLKKEDLEELKCHIYAKHGYNFNVNDGLSFLYTIPPKLKALFDGDISIKKSEASQYSSIIGCSREQLIIVLESSEIFFKSSHLGKREGLT